MCGCRSFLWSCIIPAEFWRNETESVPGFAGSEQSKQIVFAPSEEPTFVNVPQNNFVEPFVLNPGTWTVVVEAEGILLVSRRRVWTRDGRVLCGSDVTVLLCSLRITWFCCPAPITKLRSCSTK